MPTVGIRSASLRGGPAASATDIGAGAWLGSAHVLVLALMYHDVVAGDPDASGFPGTGPNHYKLRADRFETHLDAIEALGLRPSLVDEPIAEMTLLLTFDDGGGSASTQIAPMLEGRGWRGHFFVTTDRIGTQGFLTRDQLLALHEAGHVVGSHAHTHRALTKLGDGDARGEWSESKAVLEDVLGATVVVASVPTGRYSERIATLAAHVGYEHLFTSEPWLEPRRADTVLVYGRYAVHAGTSAARITALCSLSRPTLLWMGGGWYARKAAKAVLGPVYDPLRRRLLTRMR
jgi:peptidoglycan/xylan/chitin deacetylase (PgdA/CDA1 family)